MAQPAVIELVNRNTASTHRNEKQEETDVAKIEARLDALEKTVQVITKEMKKQLTVDIPSFEPVNSKPPSAAANSSDDTP